MKATIGELLEKKSVLVMGVLNVTPDSFSDGGNYFDLPLAVKKAKEMICDGADIIDIGGESTRPYAEPVLKEEELRRVVPVIEALRDVEALISIDTTKAAVAEAALVSGATIVNDISSLELDTQMGSVILKHQAQVVLMHMQGMPATMQNNPVYAEVVDDVLAYLKQRLEQAVNLGIDRKNIIIDPGIGFGKKLQDNLKIIKNLTRFKDLGVPVLIGVSRKSFIGKVLNIEEAGERIFGTAAALCLSIVNGANIVRVHDVAQMRQVVRITESILSA